MTLIFSALNIVWTAHSSNPSTRRCRLRYSSSPIPRRGNPRCSSNPSALRVAHQVPAQLILTNSQPIGSGPAHYIVLPHGNRPYRPRMTTWSDIDVLFNIRTRLGGSSSKKQRKKQSCHQLRCNTCITILFRQCLKTNTFEMLLDQTP